MLSRAEARALLKFGSAAESAPESPRSNAACERTESPCKMRAPPSSALYLSVSLNTDETYLNAGNSDEQTPNANIAASFAIRRLPLKIFIRKTYSGHLKVATIFCAAKARAKKTEARHGTPVFCINSVSRLIVDGRIQSVVGKDRRGSTAIDSVSFRMRHHNGL